MERKSLTLKDKGILVFLAAVLFACLTVSAVFALDLSENASADEASFFGGGDGSAISPYIISEEAHLHNLSALIVTDNVDYGNKNYIMTADIYMTEELSPIGTDSYPFAGTFNGKYYSIYGLIIDETKSYVGLFGTIGATACVEKINLLPIVDDVTAIGEITSTGNYVGGIVGESRGGRIVDCLNALPVTGFGRVGGIAGSAEEGTFLRNRNSGTVSGGDYVGGLVGDSSARIEYSFNGGNVFASGNYIGGICGRLYGAKGSLSTCYNGGAINITAEIGECAGGLVGYVNIADGTTNLIAYCYNIGALNNNSTKTSIGALIGCSDYTGNALSMCYNNIEMAAFDFIGEGEVNKYSDTHSLYTASMVGSTAFDAGNMENISSSGSFILSGGRSAVADYAPRLVLFPSGSPNASENPQAETILAKYSEQSVMLRLFGAAGNINWGSQANPYLIQSMSHFETLQIQVNENSHSYAGEYFLLETDLDFSLVNNYTPIGKFCGLGNPENRVFSATFDGNGHTVSGITANYPDAASSIGFFGYTGTASVIKNLIIEAVAFEGKNNTGLAVGYCEGSVLRVHAKAAEVKGTGNVGGIIGNYVSSSSTTVNNCVFEGDIAGQDVGTRGGIAGWQTGIGSIVNSWFIPASGKNNQSNTRGSTLVADTYGQVYASIDVTTETEEEIIAFHVKPDSGFGFAFRNWPQNTDFVFNHTYTDVGDEYVRHPGYVRGYAGESATWYLRFTKTVAIGAVENGSATGQGQYFVGETVFIKVTPKQGYRLVLEPSSYAYSSDGETVSCSWVMGEAEYTFTAQCVLFGNDDDGSGEISFDGQVISTAIENGEVVAGFLDQGSIVKAAFDYDGTAKVFSVNLALSAQIYNYTTFYYRVSSTGREAVSDAVNANEFALVIRLYETVSGNALYVGKKEVLFRIVPKKLQLDTEAFRTDAYYNSKQYDKLHSDTVSIRLADIKNAVDGDTIALEATRIFMANGLEDASVGASTDTPAKFVKFVSFRLSGISAGNYVIPDDLEEISGTGIGGNITKRKATIIVSFSNLTMEYTGAMPTVGVIDVDGALQNDNINLGAAFTFTLTDDLGATGDWCIGTYKIGFDYDKITGDKANYELSIEDANFVISPRKIATVSFSGITGLSYDGTDKASGISGTYQAQPSGIKNATLTFYYNGVKATECKDAGSYVVAAEISDLNYALSTEQNASFVIAKINPEIIVIAPINAMDYSLDDVELTFTGSSGVGTVVFEIVSGKASVSSSQQGHFLKVNGAGTIVLRAKENASTNYNERYSDAITVTVRKARLFAYVSDIYVRYGEAPSAAIVYKDANDSLVAAADISGLVAPSVFFPDETDASDTGYGFWLNDDGLSDGYIIDVSRASGLMYVAKKQIRIEADNLTKVYGSADPYLSYTVSGETGIVLSGGLSRVVGNNAGKYLITQGTLDEINNPNYEIVFIGAYLTVEKKELRVSVPSMTKVYGNADPSFYFDVAPEELCYNDTVSVVRGTITRSAGEQSGTYALRVSNENAGDNYSLRIVSYGNLTILKATPFVLDEPLAEELVYGSKLSESVLSGKLYVYANAVLTEVNGRFSWKDGDILPHVINSGVTFYKLTFSPTDGDNYNSVELELPVTVRPRNATVSFIGELASVYDGKSKKISASAGNVLSGDTVKVTLSYSDTNVARAGTYTVTASITNPDYVLTGLTTVTISIYKAELTATAEDLTVYEGEVISPNVSYTGFKNGENESVFIKQPTVKADKDKGKLTPSGGEAENYSFYYVSGTLTVLPVVYESDNVKLTGKGVSDSLTVTVREMDEKSASFTQLQSDLQSAISEIDEGKSMGTYLAVSFSESVNGLFEYEIKCTLAENSEIVLVYTDGSVASLLDYTYEDGVLKFKSGQIMGISTLKEKSLLDNWQGTLLKVGIIAGAAIALAAVIVIIVSSKKRKKRRTPIYRD